MISKELLSEVLGGNITMLHQRDNIINYDIEDKPMPFINIHELAHKVKEWANNQDKQYELNSYVTKSHEGACCDVYEAYHGNTAYGDFQYQVFARTETEAIFQAGKWILENR